jgi:hypothetical protein
VVRKSSVFWDITSCSLLKTNHHFGGICRFHLQGQRISQGRDQCEASSKKHQMTQHYIPEDRTLHKYSTQNCWVFRLCPSSSILKLENITFWKLDLFLSSGEGETPILLGPLVRANLSHWTQICFSPQVWGETPTLLCPLERANLNHWKNCVF